MSRSILIKPLISEKAEELSNKRNNYTFVVDKKANKLEIRQAIEDMFKVNVIAVNTAIMPAKAKSRGTRAGYVKGRVASFKKAVITLAEGDKIDFFN